jgi:hypothetical protein
MTDVAEATIASWRTHDALRPYFRAGRLEAARFDADRDGRLHIGRGASALTPDAPARHLVVIANYLFSGLRQDAFAIGGGRLREYLAAAAWARGRPRHPADVSVAWRVGGFASAPYANPELDGLVHECGKTSADGRFLFPIGALRCLDRLAACASDALLVLVADRGTRDEGAATTRAADLELGRHGALSFPVSFHALRRWTVRRGGVWLPSPRRSRHLQVAGFMLGRRRRWIATRRAYAAALAAGEPDALYGERRALAGMASARLPALLSLMRRAGADPRVVAECVRPLWSHLSRPDPWLRREIRDAVRAAWASYYHADAIDDVPFHLGLLLYQVGAYADAQHLFEASIRLHGEHAAARWNLGLCQLALRRPHAAQSSLRRARAMCPTLQPAGLILSKA